MKVQIFYSSMFGTSYEYFLFTKNKVSYYLSFIKERVSIESDYEYNYQPKNKYIPTKIQKHLAIQKIFIKLISFS